MQLNTKHFGVIEVDEKEILYFPSGIPGFENVRKFVLLGRQEPTALFSGSSVLINPIWRLL
ncbi:hypothetical protein [Thermoclostridium stercorarium]|uniref:hypothetical protein n=1 Tax=Thermoclostridium stercorarium TaxID=1510 RepID=UPI000A645CBA|nr:hypothetical protein [Thermoclostridium stercorarium]